jgi:hypothetical protein
MCRAKSQNDYSLLRRCLQRFLATNKRLSKLLLYDCQGRILAADVHHRARRGHKIRLADVVALFFLLNNALDKLC